MKSLFIALAMYSKIPVPRVEWNEKNMKYSMAFFPVVGVFVGLVLFICMYILELADINVILKAVIATIIPVLITGGIHLDGYLDTVDAINSYADTKKKLEILKDPNVGAFAVIYGIIYFLMVFGLYTELDKRAYIFVCIGFVLSRCLSALTVLWFPKAKNSGLAAMFKDSADKWRVTSVLLIYLIIIALLVGFLNIWVLVIWIFMSLAALLGYYIFCKRNFGGMTGDLAGFFLTVFELLILIACVTIFKII